MAGKDVPVNKDTPTKDSDFEVLKKVPKGGGGGSKGKDAPKGKGGR